VFRHSHHNAGENPEMRTLFYRLCHLLRHHTHAIFVFDGPGRPEIKRGKKVKKTPHWLKRAFVDMLGLFGFAVHEVIMFLQVSVQSNSLLRQAPAEAEAELARLNRLSIVNAVLTDDVDTFLFGAFTVIRK
jgi:Holliday junction resolvase YEN1